MSWLKWHKASPPSMNVRSMRMIESGLAGIVPPRLLLDADREFEVRGLITGIESQAGEIAALGESMNYHPDSHVKTAEALKDWLKSNTGHPHDAIDNTVDSYTTLCLEPRVNTSGLQTISR